MMPILVRRTLLSAAIAAGVSVAPLVASAREQRCAQLGASCLCSEPLDTTSYRTVNNEYVDPDDSPDATECPGEIGGGAAWYKRSQVNPVPETGMPAGNTVTHVWENRARAGMSHMYGKKATSSARRMCQRHYFRFSSDYSGAVDPCLANKGEEIDFGDYRSHVQTGFQRGGSGQTPALRVGGFSKTGAAKNLSGSGSLTLDDCKNQWCLRETCVSGDLSTGRDIYVTAYLRGVSDGKRRDFARFHAGDAITGKGILKAELLNMYRQGSCTGTRSFSHVMQAEWSVDNGQFIGAAAEVESGSGSGSTGGGSTGGGSTGGGSTGGGSTGGGSTGGGAALSPPARPELLP